MSVSFLSKDFLLQGVRLFCLGVSHNGIRTFHILPTSAEIPTGNTYSSFILSLKSSPFLEGLSLCLKLAPLSFLQTVYWWMY